MPPPEPTLIFLNSFLTVHLYNYKLEVCRQSLGPLLQTILQTSPPPYLPHASRRFVFQAWNAAFVVGSTTDATATGRADILQASGRES